MASYQANGAWLGWLHIPQKQALAGLAHQRRAPAIRGDRGVGGGPGIPGSAAVAW